MKQPAIAARHLTKSFGGKEVIHDCSLSVEQGSLYGVLGRNGAGKTTLFKLLLGLQHPTAGTASVMGLDIVQDCGAILRRTGSLIETPVFYEHLSAVENLRLHLAYMEKEADPLPVLEQVGLGDAGCQPVSEFSLGMRQRLGIARALVHQPEVLMLDEPINGLDPVGIRELRVLFLHLAKEKGITILFSSHILSEVEQLADHVGIMAGGKIIQEAAMENLRRRHPTGMESYLLSVMQGGEPDV